MSRIGKKKLIVPEGVEIRKEANNVFVKGPKGELSTTVAEGIQIKIEANELVVEKTDDVSKAIHGTTNSVIQNLITGVTKGYEKKLEVVGVGYRFALKGNTLVVSVGYSKPIEVTIPKGLTVEIVNNTEIVVKGIDNVLLGEFVANVRKLRKPEPYKGKGIRYKDEQVRRKEGKKAA